MKRLWNIIKFRFFPSNEEKEFGEKYKTLRMSAIEWNVTTLTDNTFIMQVRKICEEVGEVLDAMETNPEDVIKEKADVLIAIWGLSAFDEIASNIAEQCFWLLNGDGKEIIKEAESKLIELHKRTYVKVNGVYRHETKRNTLN